MSNLTAFLIGVVITKSAILGLLIALEKIEKRKDRKQRGY